MPKKNTTVLDQVRDCDAHLSALLGLKRAAIKRGELVRVAQLEQKIDRWLVRRFDAQHEYQQAA